MYPAALYGNGYIVALPFHTYRVLGVVVKNYVAHFKTFAAVYTIFGLFAAACNKMYTPPIDRSVFANAFDCKVKRISYARHTAVIAHAAAEIGRIVCRKAFYGAFHRSADFRADLADYSYVNRAVFE